MHTLTIPQDANIHGVLIDQATGKPRDVLSFKDFWLGFMAARVPRSNAAETKCLVSLCEKLNDCKAADVVEITDAEHEALCKALPPSMSREHPDGIHSSMLVHTTQFFLAVQSA